jgi:hypothetical protein
VYMFLIISPIGIVHLFIKTKAKRQYSMLNIIVGISIILLNLYLYNWQFV